MRWIAALSCLWAITAVLTASAAEPPPSPRVVVVAADRWCPVNCGVNDALPGYAIEMATEAFAQSGWKTEYRVMPWERAIDATRDGRLDAIVGTIRVNTPDFLFPAETIGINVNAFFAREGDPWRYYGLHSLEKAVIGVANEYQFGGAFDDYVARHGRNPKRLAIIYSQDPVRQGLKLVAAGRITAYLDDRMVVNWALRQAGSPTGIREVGELTREELYLAFSPSRADSRATAAAFDRGVRELRASGRLAGILARYGVRDWGNGMPPSGEPDANP